jgi:hypothetical protein
MGGLVGADELAALGLRALHFSPVGRGASWGHDDFCGLEGQDSLRAALEYLHAARGVDPNRVVVLSFSLGLALAAPVLARCAARLGTHSLIDWEGPATRGAMKALGDLPPAAEAARLADPEGFWRIREPIEVIADLPCHYIRLQSEVDHATGSDGQGAALALLRAAAQGLAASTRLNDNPADTTWSESSAGGLRWAPTGAAQINRLIQRQLRDLFEL